MPEASLWFLVLVICLAIAFDFANGFNDAANAIATVVSTRVLHPTAAVAMGAALNFVGALTGTEVARVVGSGIVDPGAITLVTVAAGVGAAAIWVFLASRLGLPVSGSHSLIAGMVGAGLMAAGPGVLVWHGISKTLLGLVLAPVFGLLGGFGLMLAIYWLFRRANLSRASAVFSRLQIFSAAFMAFSHGNNDAQKTMGIIALAVAVYSGWAEKGIAFHIPVWVMLLSATVMAVGTYVGGWKVIRTLGVKIAAMRPVNGFAAETAAAAVIESASRLGFPLSTTHVISSSIMGQGATRRLSAVRWGVARSIMAAWLFTFPFCTALGAVLLLLLKLVL